MSTRWFALYQPPLFEHHSHNATRSLASLTVQKTYFAQLRMTLVFFGRILLWFLPLPSPVPLATGDLLAAEYVVLFVGVRVMRRRRFATSFVRTALLTLATDYV